MNYLNKNLTFLGVNSVFNNGYVGFKNPNTTAILYDARIYEGSNDGCTDYTNGNGLLYVDFKKAVFNSPIQSRYYNNKFEHKMCSKTGNDTMNICIYYQTYTPYLQVSDVIINSSRRISLNAPVIQLNSNTLQSQEFGKDNFCNEYESINQIFK